MNFFQSKKGDLPDMLIFIVTIFVFSIGLLVLAFVVPEIADGLNIAGLNDSNATRDAITELENFPNIINRGFFLLFAGLVMSLMITSFFVRVHPIFLFLWIIVLGITIFVGLYLGNAYETLQNVGVLSDVNPTLINLVWENIIKITLAAGALSIVIVFVKFVSGTPRRL